MNLQLLLRCLRCTAQPPSLLLFVACCCNVLGVELSADEIRKDKTTKNLSGEKKIKSLEKRGWKFEHKEEKQAFKALWGKEKKKPVDVAEPAEKQIARPINRQPYAPASSYRKRRIERVTVDIPEKYLELDKDLDGQIGIYEWLLEKRLEIPVFEAIDVDQDGLLTPRELVDFDSVESENSSSKPVSQLVVKRNRLRIIGGTYALTGKGITPNRELPKGYNPGRGKTREESAKLHQGYVDSRMAKLSPQQKARIGQLWKEKQRNDPNMKNRGAAFVRIMEYVAENEK